MNFDDILKDLYDNILLLEDSTCSYNQGIFYLYTRVVYKKYL